MKWSIPCFLMMNWKSEYLSKIDRLHIYHQKPLEISYSSIEHIIPQKFFKEKKHAHHPKNIVPCDRFTNSIRSDYKYDDPQHYQHIFEKYPLHRGNKNSILPINDYFKYVTDYSGEITGLIYPKKRIFVPSPQADLPLLCRSIIYMLYHYHYLYRYLDEIIADTAMLDHYASQPPSPLEKSIGSYISSLE